jgi:plastocyanin
MIRISIALVALAAGLTLMLSMPTGAAPKVVKGTVGPGYTISLTSGGKKVTSLKAGTYRIDVLDRSSIHDFHLIGQGLNKVITGVSFQGRKSVTVKLKRGTHRFLCDPHASFMKGSFRVS